MRRTYHDPVTHDELSLGEYTALLIQGVIRRWLFLAFITTVTLVVWIVGAFLPAALVWWNLAASLLAVMIESIVGMFLFGQMKRDAVILRKLEHVLEHVESQETAIYEIVTHVKSISEPIKIIIPEPSKEET